jgi:hypothetical protein
MENIKDWMQIIQFIIFMGVAVFGIFFYFSKPDERASARISKVETECPLRHDKINYITDQLRESIFKIEKTLIMLQENDLKHIEQEQRRMSDTQTEILTILKERKIT